MQQVFSLGVDEYSIARRINNAASILYTMEKKYLTSVLGFS